MSNNIRIESGNEYSLGQLFSENNTIIIPDLQRDYCWGKDALIEKLTNHGNLVKDFVENLFQLYKENEEKPISSQTMGLIYGYELPLNHIQICDGQQRLTTLFLLLGFINLKANNTFRENLISPDDYEPRLQYAIRESTLYFMSNLTQKVFISTESNLDNVLEIATSKKNDASPIKIPIWYFSEYDLDPSIQNILAALETINKWADSNCKSWSLREWTDFGDFLINKLVFIYYDMETRSKGEETYIVINTTGEPLSPSENIKPIVLGQIFDPSDKKNDLILRRQYSSEWEEREQWFWEYRDHDITSDEKSYKFLELYWQIGLLQQDVSPRERFQKSSPKASKEMVNRWNLFKNPKTIHLYFKAFQQLIKKLSEESENEPLQNIFRSISDNGLLNGKPFEVKLTNIFKGDKDWLQDIILPGIAYLVRFPEAKQLTRFMCRLRKNYFDRLRIRNPYPDNKKKSSSYVDWRYIIQIVEMSKSEKEVLTFDTKAPENAFIIREDESKLNIWYGQSEKDLEILSQPNTGIDVIEWGEHRTLMGDLTPLIVRKANDDIDIDATKKRWDNLIKLSNSIEKQPDSLSDVTNWYRLYRVLTGIVPIKYHTGRQRLNQEGCLYSKCFDCKDDSDFAYLLDQNFSKLLDSNDLLLDLKRECLVQLENSKILSGSMESMDAQKLIKAFLFAKTLVNEGRTINDSCDNWPINPAHDNYPISANAWEPNMNRISCEFPIEWGNLQCLYGYKSKHEWVKNCSHKGPEYLDTTLEGNFVPPEGLTITADTIVKNTRIIEEKIKALKQELVFQDSIAENFTINS